MMIYEKGNVVFAFNFHPNRSFEGYFVPVSKAGKYHAVLTSDESRFGGQDRIAKDVVYNTVELPDGRTGFFAYLPSRTAAAFCRIEDAVSKKETAAAKDAVEKPKRGRPRKAKTEELTEAAKTTEKPTRSRRVKKEAAEEVPAEKPKRGRPRKVKEQEPEVTPKKEAAEVPAEKPKRGRPRKKPVEAAAPEK